MGAGSYLGSGDVYIDRLDSNNTPTGYRLEGSVKDFQIQVENEIKEQISKGRSTYGQVLATAVIPGKPTVSFTLQKVSSTNMAMAVLGAAVTGSQAAGSVEAEAATISALGVYVALSKAKISNVVVQDATDTTTYDEGVDYQVDYDLGMIMAISGGAITAADVLHVDFDHAAYDYSDITGNSDPNIKVRIRFGGKNFVDGKTLDAVCFQVALRPTSALQLLSDDFMEVALEGNCEIPDSGTTAFTIRRQE